MSNDAQSAHLRCSSVGSHHLSITLYVLVFTTSHHTLVTSNHKLVALRLFERSNIELVAMLDSDDEIVELMLVRALSDIPPRDDGGSKGNGVRLDVDDLEWLKY